MQKNIFWIILAVVMMVSSCAHNVPVLTRDTAVVSTAVSQQEPAEEVDIYSLGITEASTEKVDTKGPDISRESYSQEYVSTEEVRNLRKTLARTTEIALETRKSTNNIKGRLSILEDRFDASPSGSIKAEVVLFRSGSVELTKKGKEMGDFLAEGYKNGAIKDIKITGHASKTKFKIKKMNNKILSEKRACKFAEYLEKKGAVIQLNNIRGDGETDRYPENQNVSITWKARK